MIRILLTTLILLLPAAARAQGDAQTLVDRSTLTLQDIMAPPDAQTSRNLLQRAKGVLICPRIFKAGFIIGGSGGSCVLVGRGGAGTWSYPAFYGMGSGSVGLQLGIQDSEFVFLILTDKGLSAVLDSQFKLGGDASATVAAFGGGVQGSTTTSFGADIVAFSDARGLFTGLSLEGSVLSAHNDWAQGYYGRDFSTRQIVLDMQGANPGADPLRELLMRFAAAQPTPPPSPSYQAGSPPPGYQAPTQPVPLQPGGPVQQQNLPPPQR
jgi:SH3 domain-containing YSC84-like protein 1